MHPPHLSRDEAPPQAVEFAPEPGKYSCTLIQPLFQIWKEGSLLSLYNRVTLAAQVPRF